MNEFIFAIISTAINKESYEIACQTKCVGEIVRCKECEFAKEYIDSQNHSLLYCENWRATDCGYNEGYYRIENDFFCADGKRRESEC